jgi:hypothetical protein
MTYRTLVAREQAVDASQIMLKDRHRVLITYLEMLREKLAVSSGIDPIRRASFETSISNNINSLNNTFVSIDSQETLADIVKFSQGIDSRYYNIRALSYRIRSHITFARIVEVRLNAAEVVKITDEQINRIRNEGLKDAESVENLSRWVLSADQSMTLAETRQDTAKSYLDKYVASSNATKLKNDYNNNRSRMTRSLQYVEDAFSVVSEIIRNIKIQN